MPEPSARIRLANADDLAAILDFGARVVPAHYGPLLGAEAARRQVTQWWSEATIAPAVHDGYVLLATTAAGGVLGVTQWGVLPSTTPPEPVVWKLYLEPGARGAGLGARLLSAADEAGRRRTGASRTWVEQLFGNARAGRFYERERFAVDHVVPHGAGSRPDSAPSHPLDVVWRSRTRPGR